MVKLRFFIGILFDSPQNKSQSGRWKKRVNEWGRLSSETTRISVKGDGLVAYAFRTGNPAAHPQIPDIRRRSFRIWRFWLTIAGTNCPEMRTNTWREVPGMTLLVWLAYWLGWVLMFSNFRQDTGAVLAASVNVGLQAGIVYVNILLLIPSLLEKRRYFLYGFLCFVMLVLFAKLQMTLVPADSKLILKRNIQYPRAFQFVRIYLFFMVVLIVSTAWKFAIDRFKNLQTQTELSKRQLESELQFLKSQIRPHFLFNTLNNIYTLAYLKEDSAAPMIMKLSELLRYMLYQCQGQYVALQDEVAFLHNVVALQRLKSDIYQRNIRFESAGIRPGDRIAPLLLLTFLENSFKYSDLDLNVDGRIHIGLEVNGAGSLSFYCFNTKRPGVPATSESGGIGLYNVRKRLELVYPGRHALDITDNADNFEIRLTLNL